MKGAKDRSIVAEVRKAIRGGGPAQLRRQLERDGPWLDVFVSPSTTGVSVTVQDRARGKEREAERSLRDSETRFRSVVESLREGLIITDLNDRIEYVNHRPHRAPPRGSGRKAGPGAAVRHRELEGTGKADDGSAREETYSIQGATHR